MNVKLISFGYRYGRPKANIIINVKKLPNPWHIKRLHNLKGTDYEVRNYVVDNEFGKQLVDRVFNNIISKIEQNIVVAIGCHGGKHRSVAVVCELHDRLVNYGDFVIIEHRDINRK